MTAAGATAYRKYRDRHMSERVGSNGMKLVGVYVDPSGFHSHAIAQKEDVLASLPRRNSESTVPPTAAPPTG